VDEVSGQSQVHLKLLLEQMPAILWVADANFRFTSTWGAGLAGLGLTPEQVVGLTLFEFFRTDDPEFLPIAMHRRALRGESGTFAVTWNGHTFHSHVEPLTDAGGRITGTVGVALDITERKRAEEALQESQRSLATLLSNLPGMAYRGGADWDRTMEFVSA